MTFRVVCVALVAAVLVLVGVTVKSAPRACTVKFTLYEGEHLAPLGPGGELIRVRVRAGTPSFVKNKRGIVTSSWPSVVAWPVDPSEALAWSWTPATLPAEMSVDVPCDPNP